MPPAQSTIDKDMIDKEQQATERWRHEDELINQRLTWLLSAHALLGSGYAWLKYRIAEITLDAAMRDAATQALTAPALKYTHEIARLMGFLAYVGVFVALFALMGLVAACVAQKRLQARYPTVELGVSQGTTNLGRCAALSLPAACLGGWAYMLTPDSGRCVAMALVALGSAIVLLIGLEWAPPQRQTRTRP
jgi:hypothetical protein